jgi:glycosyltransferase involved in cell wall biosynthesis
MVERFNALAERGNVELEVWFSDRAKADRSWNVDEATWLFRYRYLPAIRVLGMRLHWPLPLVRRRPDILFSLYAQPCFAFGWLIAKLRGSKTGFRVLKTHGRWVRRHCAKDALKRFMFKRVDAIETPGKDGKEYAVKYGARPERVFFATHTIDFPYLVQESATARACRELYRREENLKGVVFLFVGRLYAEKGLGVLVDAFEMIQEKVDGPTTLLLVGDGPEERHLRDVCKERGLGNVRFAGYKQKLELPKWYAISDIFVFPTFDDGYGLVIDEAMACGLAVISTSAVGEIRDRIEDGANGYVVPPGDSRALAERMLALANSSQARALMGERSVWKVQGHTPENWARDFEHIVRHLLGETKF